MKKIKCSYWSIEEEKKQAIDYYKFLDEKVIDKVQKLYDSERFSKFEPINQEDPNLVPVVFHDNKPITQTLRIRPVFNIHEIELLQVDLSPQNLLFRTSEKHSVQEKFIFEIQLQENVYICAEVENIFNKDHKFLYKTKVILPLCNKFQLYQSNLRAALEL